jgi:hypothetical protein
MPQSVNVKEEAVSRERLRVCMMVPCIRVCRVRTLGIHARSDLLFSGIRRRQYSKLIEREKFPMLE